MNMGARTKVYTEMYGFIKYITIFKHRHNNNNITDNNNNNKYNNIFVCYSKNVNKISNNRHMDRWSNR